MRILGTISSALIANVSSFESIATVSYPSGTGGAAVFSSIPSKYRHLQLRALIRDTENVNNSLWFLTFNGTTAPNCGTIGAQFNGTSVSSYTEGNLSAIRGVSAGANAGSSRFAHTIIDIFDVNQTDKYKTGSIMSAYTNNNSTTGRMHATGFNWQSQNAITQVTLTPSTAFAQYTHIALYGIL